MQIIMTDVEKELKKILYGFEAKHELKWINHFDRPWQCPHVNKCEVLVDNDEFLYRCTTDDPEPEIPYRYVFLIDFFPGLTKREYIPCDCKKVEK